MHHSFSKLERILILIIRKTKALEVGQIHFKTHLNTFVSNMFFILKIMSFENVFSTKVTHFDVIKAWMHNIKDVIKIILYPSQCTCKMGMKNAKHRKINQHRNAMCQM